MTNTEKEKNFVTESSGKSHQVIGSQIKQPSLTRPIFHIGKYHCSEVAVSLYTWTPASLFTPLHAVGLSILGLH